MSRTDDDLAALLAVPPKRTYPNARMDSFNAPADLDQPQAMTFTIPLPVKPKVGPTMKYAGTVYRVADWRWHPYGRYPVEGTDGNTYTGEATIALELPE